jgi:hypothetical protein
MKKNLKTSFEISGFSNLKQGNLTVTQNGSKMGLAFLDRVHPTPGLAPTTLRPAGGHPWTGHSRTGLTTGP